MKHNCRSRPAGDGGEIRTHGALGLSGLANLRIQPCSATSSYVRSCHMGLMCAYCAIITHPRSYPRNLCTVYFGVSALFRLSENRMERMTGIEPAQPAWKAGALPLCNIRVVCPLPRLVRSACRREGSRWSRGAVGGTRNHDRLLTKQLLYRLSYDSKCRTADGKPSRRTSRLFRAANKHFIKKEDSSWGRGGVEPPTCSLSFCCYSTVELYSPYARMAAGLGFVG